MRNTLEHTQPPRSSSAIPGASLEAFTRHFCQKIPDHWQETLFEHDFMEKVKPLFLSDYMILVRELRNNPHALLYHPEIVEAFVHKVHCFVPLLVLSPEALDVQRQGYTGMVVTDYYRELFHVGVMPLYRQFKQDDPTRASVFLSTVYHAMCYTLVASATWAEERLPGGSTPIEQHVFTEQSKRIWACRQLALDVCYVFHQFLGEKASLFHEVRPWQRLLEEEANHLEALLWLQPFDYVTQTCQPPNGLFAGPATVHEHGLTVETAEIVMARWRQLFALTTLKKQQTLFRDTIGQWAKPRLRAMEAALERKVKGKAALDDPAAPEDVYLAYLHWLYDQGCYVSLRVLSNQTDLHGRHREDYLTLMKRAQEAEEDNAQRFAPVTWLPSTWPPDADRVKKNLRQATYLSQERYAYHPLKPWLYDPCHEGQAHRLYPFSFSLRRHLQQLRVAFKNAMEHGTADFLTAQQRFTRGAITLMQHLFNAAACLAGEPPCGYAVGGMGSLTYGLLPYSDLDWFVILQHAPALDALSDEAFRRAVYPYFHRLVCLVQAFLHNLGEEYGLGATGWHWDREDLNRLGLKNREHFVKRGCDHAQGYFDFCLIDTPQGYQEQFKTYLATVEFSQKWEERLTPQAQVAFSLLHTCEIYHSEGASELYHAYDEAVTRHVSQKTEVFPQDVFNRFALPVFAYVRRALRQYVSWDEAIPTGMIALKKEFIHPLVLAMLGLRVYVSQWRGIPLPSLSLASVLLEEANAGVSPADGVNDPFSTTIPHTTQSSHRQGSFEPATWRTFLARTPSEKEGHHPFIQSCPSFDGREKTTTKTHQRAVGQAKTVAREEAMRRVLLPRDQKEEEGCWGVLHQGFHPSDVMLWQWALQTMQALRCDVMFALESGVENVTRNPIEATHDVGLVSQGAYDVLQRIERTVFQPLRFYLGQLSRDISSPPVHAFDNRVSPAVAYFLHLTEAKKKASVYSADRQYQAFHQDWEKEAGRFLLTYWVVLDALPLQQAITVTIVEALAHRQRDAFVGCLQLLTYGDPHTLRRLKCHGEDYAGIPALANALLNHLKDVAYADGWRVTEIPFVEWVSTHYHYVDAIKEWTEEAALPGHSSASAAYHAQTMTSLVNRWKAQGHSDENDNAFLADLAQFFQGEAPLAYKQQLVGFIDMGVHNAYGIALSHVEKSEHEERLSMGWQARYRLEAGKSHFLLTYQYEKAVWQVLESPFLLSVLKKRHGYAFEAKRREAQKSVIIFLGSMRYPDLLAMDFTERVQVLNVLLKAYGCVVKSDVPRRVQEGFLQAVQALPALGEMLFLSGYQYFQARGEFYARENDILRVLRGQAHVKHVWLERCLGFRGGDLRQLPKAEYCPHLKSLMISHNVDTESYFSDACLHSLHGASPDEPLYFAVLTRLILSQCAGLRSVNVDAPQLAHLKINHCPQLGQGQARVTFYHTHALQTVELAYLPALVCIVFPSTTALTAVDVRHCARLQTMVLKALPEQGRVWSLRLDDCPSLMTITLGDDRFDLNETKACHEGARDSVAGRLLLKAVGMGRTDLVDALVRGHGEALLETQTRHGDSLLLHAVCVGGIVSFEHLLTHYSEYFTLSHCDAYGCNALLLAARHGQMAMLRHLLEKYSDSAPVQPPRLSLMACDHDGCTALMTASAHGQEAVLRYLLGDPTYRSTIRLNAQNRQGETALTLAIRHDHVAVVNYLVDVGCSLQQGNCMGMTPLEVAYACEASSVILDVLMTKLFDEGCLPSPKSWHHAVMFAQDESRILTLKARLAREVSPPYCDLLTKEGAHTLWHSVAGLGKKALLEYLLSTTRADDITQPNRLGLTPLHCAVVRRGAESEDIVKLLLKRGADVTARCREGLTPLHYAVYYRRVTLLDSLMDNLLLRDKADFCCHTDDFTPSQRQLLTRQFERRQACARLVWEAEARRSPLLMTLPRLLPQHKAGVSSERRLGDALPVLSEGGPSLPALSRDLLEIDRRRITLGGRLNAGTYGTVYGARYDFDEVAVKALKVDQYDPQIVKELKEEAHAMLGAQSPHVVRLFGYCTTTLPFWLVMELMPGGSLYDVLHGRQIALSCERRTAWALQIAKGLLALHRAHILHRDVKSANILLNTAEEAKLTDFGLAKMKDDVNMTQTSHQERVGGTYAWMAPELFGPGRPSEASDVYSYGLVLWEMETNQLPFHEATNPMDLIRLKDARGDQQEKVPSTTPKAYANVMQACWQMAPEKRPRALAVIEALTVFFAQGASNTAHAQHGPSRAPREGKPALKLPRAWRGEGGPPSSFFHRYDRVCDEMGEGKEDKRSDDKGDKGKRPA